MIPPSGSVTKRLVQVDAQGHVTGVSEASQSQADWDAAAEKNRAAYGSDFPPGQVEVTGTHTYEQACALALGLATFNATTRVFTIPNTVKVSPPQIADVQTQLTAMSVTLDAILAALKP